MMDSWGDPVLLLGRNFFAHFFGIYFGFVLKEISTFHFRLTAPILSLFMLKNQIWSYVDSDYLVKSNVSNKVLFSRNVFQEPFRNADGKNLQSGP